MAHARIDSSVYSELHKLDKCMHIAYIQSFLKAQAFVVNIVFLATELCLIAEMTKGKGGRFAR